MSLVSIAGLGPATILVVACVTTAMAPVALLLATSALVSRAHSSFGDGLSSADERATLVLLGAVGVILLVERLAGVVFGAFRTVIARRIDGALLGEAVEALGAAPSVAIHEDPAVQDQLSQLRGGFLGTPGEAAVATWAVVVRYLQALSCLAVIAVLSPIAAVYGLVVVLVTRRRWHVAFATMTITAMLNEQTLRRSQYFADLALRPEAAKEVRLFGILDWLVGRHRALWDEAVEPTFAVRRQMRRQANWELALLLSSAILTIGLAARAAARGDIGVGLFSAVVQAQVFAGLLIGPTPDDYVAGVATAGRGARQALGLATAGAADDGARMAPGSPANAIRFEGVTFSYPGSGTPVLRDVDLTIRPGESLAIVGANGAGKSTLVKLLCGLYAPSAGRVTVDGHDLASLDRRDWSGRLAVAFQDFNRYEMSVADNVALAGGTAAEDDDALGRAIARAKMSDAVGAMPHGASTLLTRQHGDGTDLSGGQWQRMALARFFHALDRGARLAVLDEPTSSLDVRAEVELLDEVMAATTDAATVFVSHRFSTVKRADRIVVLEAGSVAEEGDHGSLMRQDGIYARMFRAQSERFTGQPTPSAP
jgi:ATP-binding cassette subfamily B protein